MEDTDPSENCVLVLQQHPTITPFWLTGMTVSTTSFLFQIGLLFCYPSCRKYDEISLCMLSFARTMNSVAEFYIVNGIFHIRYDVVLMLYVYWDFVLVCWMFVFSKNLYDKVVEVFNLSQYSLIKVSVIIYTISILPAVPSVLISYMDFSIFQIYYEVYACTKFILLIVNAYIFIRIFIVAFTNQVNRTRNIRHFVKAAIVAFILLCITSLQTLFVDAYALIGKPSCLLSLSFCVINSFQTLAMAIVFAILVYNKIMKSPRLAVSFNNKHSSVATSNSQTSAAP